MDWRTILSSWLLLLTLCVLPCNVISAQNPSKVDREPQLSLGILVDTAVHQKKVIEFEREVVNSIADAFENVATGSFVMKYGDEVELLQDWSPLETGARKVLTRIDLDMEGGKNQRTLLNDAIDAGLLKLEARNGPAAKVLIVIGEGNDVGSTARYSQIKKLANSSHVQCFALLVADHALIGGRVRGFGFNLYDLAGNTEGNAYDVGTSRKHLDKAVKDVLKRVSLVKGGPLTSGRMAFIPTSISLGSFGAQGDQLGANSFVRGKVARGTRAQVSLVPVPVLHFDDQISTRGTSGAQC